MKGRKHSYTFSGTTMLAAVQILPGAIPLDEVRPVDAGLFERCSVCGLQAAGYSHAGSGTVICSVCYEKLVREQVDVR